MVRAPILFALLAAAAPAPAQDEPPARQSAAHRLWRRPLPALDRRGDRRLPPPPGGGALPHPGAAPPQHPQYRAGLDRAGRDARRGLARFAAEQLLGGRQLRPERLHPADDPAMVRRPPRPPPRRRMRQAQGRRQRCVRACRSAIARARALASGRRRRRSRSGSRGRRAGRSSRRSATIRAAAPAPVSRSR